MDTMFPFTAEKLHDSNWQAHEEVRRNPQTLRIILGLEKSGEVKVELELGAVLNEGRSD